MLTDTHKKSDSSDPGEIPSNPSSDVEKSESTFGNTIAVDVQPLQTVTAPAQLGPYAIEHEIGRGAMGAVYRATHTKLKREVALKILPSSMQDRVDGLERFHREMAAVGQLDHPNIVKATDAGEFEGVHFLAMELIDGVDLERLIAAGKFDCASACEIARQAALGLEHICEHGLVHRDIKPSNLLLDKTGMVKILDLGIAKLRDAECTNLQTTAGKLMGTPDFMAPEQIHSTHSVDIRADIYSLGCTLYNLLVGKPPFYGPQYKTELSKYVAHSREKPTSMRRLVNGLPPEVEKIVGCMMAKNPDDRFQTPQAVVQALTPFSNASQLGEYVGDHTSSGATDRASSLHVVGVSAGRYQSRKWVAGIAVLVGCLVPAWFILANFVIPSQNRPAGGTQLLAPADQVVSEIPSPTSSLDEPSTFLAETDDVDRQQQPDGSWLPTLKGVANDTQQIHKHVAQFARSGANIEENTQRIVDSLEAIRDSFLAAERTSGLVSDPQTPGEMYHNARVWERRSNYGAAREQYLSLFATDIDFVDVHTRFQRLLKLQEGLAGARNVYHQLPGDSHTSVRRFAVALLADLPDRQKLLENLVHDFPDFAPAYFELSRCASRALLGVQSLNDRTVERQYMEKLLDLHQAGFLVRHYLDQTEAAAVIEEAQEKLTAHRVTDNQNSSQPVKLSASKHRRGWKLEFQIAEAARKILYRTGADQSYQTTEMTEQVDHRTGAEAPQNFVFLPQALDAGKIEVKYVDVRGIERGPFALEFDPAVERTKQAKQALRLTQADWVRFGRNQRSQRLYFTHLLVYQDAIAKVVYAVDSQRPNLQFQLSTAEQSFVQVDEATEYAVVQLEFHDGTRSERVRIERLPLET